MSASPITPIPTNGADSSAGEITALQKRDWFYWLMAAFTLSQLPVSLIFLFDFVLYPLEPDLIQNSVVFRIVTVGVILPLALWMAILVIRRAPYNVTGLFLLQQVTIFIAASRRDDPTLQQWNMLVMGWVAIWFLPLYFPDGRAFPRRFEPLIRGLSVVLLVSLVGWTLTAPVRVASQIPNVFLIPGTQGLFPFFSAVENITLLIIILLIPLSLISRYRQSNQTIRQQMKWLIWIFLVIILTVIPLGISGNLTLDPNTLGSLERIILSVYSAFITLAPLFAVAYAVLRYRLWDIDIIINRTLVYGAITVLVTALFFALLFLTQTLIGQTQPVVALFIAAPIAVFAFNPTQRFIQHQIDRRVFRLRYDLNEVAAAQKKPDIKNPGAFTGKVFGDYEALGVLGRGGMGEVYKGFGNNETVAIKLLLPDLAQQSDFRQRFEREAQTLARLNHPNIVKLKASGISDEVHFLAMDYIEGEELSAVVKRGAVTDYVALNDWLRDIASALDYLHGQGLVHRDLKSSNIMLRPSHDGEILQAVVMDFGIARTDASGTRLTGTGAVGTIDYMAPEQIMAARDVDQRADVYALGIITYELLIGERPFKGSAGQVLFAHLQQPAPDPRDSNPDIPRDMAKAIMKALEKNPDERFASAGEFVAALAAVQVA